MNWLRKQIYGWPGAIGMRPGRPYVNRVFPLWCAGRAIWRRLILATLVVLLLSGMSCTRMVRADPVPAQCDAVCYVSDARDDSDTACASKAKWEGDPKDPAAIDSLIYGTIPQLRKETWSCGIRLKACQQCLDRLVKAKVITKP